MIKKLILLCALLVLFLGGIAQNYHKINDKGEIILSGLPYSYESNDGNYYYKNYRLAPQSIWALDSFKIEVTPVYDDSLQYLGDLYYDSNFDIITRYVINKTQEELTNELELKYIREDNGIDQGSLRYLIQKITTPILESDSLTQKDLDEFVSFYEPFNGNGKAYKAGDFVAYKSKLYKVIIDHISQNDWTPDVAISLFVLPHIKGVVESWVQPTGGHDAYNVGDRVLFDGNTYESLINANVWSPIAYPQGWKLLN